MQSMGVVSLRKRLFLFLAILGFVLLFFTFSSVFSTTEDIILSDDALRLTVAPPMETQNVQTTTEPQNVPPAPTPQDSPRPGFWNNYRPIKWNNTCCFSKILLVVNFNSAGYASGIIPRIAALYQDTFPNIVYYAEENDTVGVEYCPETITFRNYSIPNYNGAFSYYCTALAMEKYPDYDGYLFVHDDLVINVWNLFKWDLDALIVVNDLVGPAFLDKQPPPGWDWWPRYWEALKAVSLEYSESDKANMKSKYGSERVALGKYSDIFYIPKRLASQFIHYFRMFRNAEVFLEMTMATISEGLLRDSNMKYTTGTIVWGWDRNFWYNIYNPDAEWYHALKLSDKNLWEHFYQQAWKPVFNDRCPKTCRN